MAVPMFPDDTVLLTGFPSLLARTVCAELVQSDPRTRVHAVVRSRFAKDVEAFLRDLVPDQRRTRFLSYTSLRRVRPEQLVPIPRETEASWCEDGSSGPL